MDNFINHVPFTTSGALVDIVDKKIFVSLRDGKKLIGVLRSYDQFANLVLQDTIERIHVEINKSQEQDSMNHDQDERKVICKYADIWRGIYLVRGENVVLLGEIDLDIEDEITKNFQKETSIDRVNETQKLETQIKLNSIKTREQVLFDVCGFSKEGDEDDRY